jgi:uncharacterized Zn finger protein (UPF0148 family)
MSRACPHCGELYEEEGRLVCPHCGVDVELTHADAPPESEFEEEEGEGRGEGEKGCGAAVLLVCIVLWALL